MADYTDNQIAKVSDYIAKEAGVGFYNASVLLPMVDTQYSDEYGIMVGGAQNGDTITVRFPARFTTTSSIAMSAGTIQAIKEKTKQLPLNERVAIHTNVDINQATFDLEQRGDKYSKRVLQPMGKSLNAGVESNGFRLLALESQNAIILEDLSDETAVRKEFINMKALLQKQLAPAGDRCTALGSDIEALVSNSVSTFFHSAKQIDKAYEDGTMDQHGGLSWLASDLVYSRVNGAGGNAGTAVTYVEGADTITVKPNVATEFDGIAVGDKIELDLKLINYQTYTTYGNNIQRAVKAVSGSGDAVVLTIDPIIFTDGDSQQNAKGVVNTSTTITVLGTAGETYLCCPVWQKSGITLCSADLFVPKNVEMASQNSVLNVSQRYIRAYDVTGDQLFSRFEALTQWHLLRPEWCGVVECKIS